MEAANQDLGEYLSVGTSTILQVNPQINGGQRLAATIRGWNDNDYIIVEFQEGNGAVRLSQKDVCELRYLLEGKACGFSSTIAAVERSGALPSARIKWPDSFEQVMFRKAERVKLAASCTVQTEEGGAKAVGEVCDVSLSGCCVVLEDALEEETTLLVSFTFPDGEMLEGAKGIIKNVWEQEGKFFHGLAFENDETNALVSLAGFISRVSERKRTVEGDLNQERRVLVLDDTPEIGEQCEVICEEMGFEAVSANNVVDGMYHLRVALPIILLIKQDMADLPGVEIARLVRSVISAQSLPIYLYGTLDESAKQKALDLEVVDYPNIQSALRNIPKPA